MNIDKLMKRPIFLGTKLWETLQKKSLQFISIETTTDTESTIEPLDRESFQL